MTRARHPLMPRSPEHEAELDCLNRVTRIENRGRYIGLARDQADSDRALSQHIWGDGQDAGDTAPARPIIGPPEDLRAAPFGDEPPPAFEGGRSAHAHNAPAEPRQDAENQGTRDSSEERS